MKKLVLLLPVLLFIYACNPGEGDTAMNNPFFEEWTTPFGTPPFDQIEEKHYLPAFEKGIAEQEAEIAAITGSTEEPTFENTIEAMELSGAMLERVSGVFYNLLGADTNDELQAIAKEVAPKLSKLNDDINLNPELFARVKAVYDKKDELGLSGEQEMVLEKYYKEFVRGGANLPEEDKARFREINERLSVLSLQFDEHLLKETNKFELVIEDEAELSGLPDAVIAGAAETAADRGHEGKWVFTLHKPSLIPFLQYSDQREYREKMLKGYINRGNNGGELDNKAILEEMAELRVERAHLLGYPSHAHFILEKNMAQTPENVYGLLDKLWTPALEMAKKERAMMQEMIDAEGKDFDLQAWDWWYYAEKVKKEKYDFDESEIRPYLEMTNVRKGVFDLASKLWNIEFKKLDNVPVYHPDVEAFEVKGTEGEHIGILFTDYFPRESKGGGAWMNNYREQSNMQGNEIRPVIVNVGNFSKPTADQPSLLSFDEVTTLFHEFGHALHGLLTKCSYEKLSGTSVSRDFVELPSQIMENWAGDPEYLKQYAVHYETGEPMPDELIKKLKDAGKFNQGFATVEYLAACYLDLAWHTIEEWEDVDVMEFEKKALDKIGLIDEIVVRYRSPYFAHIFAGGYSSGYYAYIWAEVLDADAYQAFKEKNDIFDQETAHAYRVNILEKGGTVDPMELYINFRGQEPDVKALLERRGLN